LKKSQNFSFNKDYTLEAVGSLQYIERYVQYLEDRVQYLEEGNRFTLDALEMATFLGDFQPSINRLQDPSVILEETRSRIQRLLKFQAIAFYLVKEEENDFFLAHTEPKNYHSYMQDEANFLIENGTFGWALREKRPVVVSSRHYNKQIILHVMATSSRIRGMFLGLLEEDKTDIPDISLSLLSIILFNSSNAIESLELYNMIREINKNLEKEENYRMLFEAAPDGVEALDARCKVVDCNKTHHAMLGYSHDEIVGKNTTDFLSEKSRSLFEKKLSVLKGSGYVEGEVEMICKDGTTIPVWRKEKAIYDESDEFVGAVVYNRDISIQKKTEEEKKNLEAQLQRAHKMEALGALAGGVAHDLNNILGGIVSYPDLLLMQLPTDSHLRKPILTIQQSGQKAAAIIQDLLTLARRGVAVSEVVNLGEIIRDYLNTPEFKKLKSFHPSVRIETDLEPDLLNILGSPIHLSKTVMNLVSNAAEAMPNGGTISISTRNQYIDTPIKGYDHVQEGDYVILAVTDTGNGISPEDIDRIFEPFYTKKVMGRSGTGLGMAVVWGTVRDHNGYIDVQSVEGNGTTFRLYFPVTRQEATKEWETHSNEDYMGKGEKILVVDDVEEQKEIAYLLLSKLGYSVTVVSSGEEAVEYMKSNSADLLVLDMIMNPGIDGLETYRQILRLHPGQKAILVTGFSETLRVKEAQKLGAGPYIRKPYILRNIGVAVRQELDKR
jgi:PAS domain S-box-containing protein